MAGGHDKYADGDTATFEANGAVSAGQLVELAAANTVGIGAAGSNIFGVALTDAAAAGDELTVALRGVYEVNSGTGAAAVAAGDFVEPDGAGNAVTAAAAQPVAAQALEATDAAGNVLVTLR